MVVFNYSGKEINAKIVYYGPGLSGKTTNLERIYGQVPENRRGKMVSMKTRSDRTLFFDFLPVNAGEIKGFRTRFLLYTVPGQVHYNATRKLVLKGTDAIIFVADSDPALRQANIESLENLEQNLAEYQLSIDRIPVILQFNKRDLPNALSIEELNADLNRHSWPHFEAVAVRNEGVWETFRAATRALFESLEKSLGGEPKAKKEPAPSPARAAGAPAGGTPGRDPAGGDGRFAPEAPVYDVGSAIDDVVRLSGTIGSWSQSITAHKKESEPAAPARPAPAEPAAEAAPAAPPPAPLPSLEGLLRAETKPVPAPAAEGPREPEKAVSVIRIPVRLESGRGMVRIEIALEIDIAEREPTPEPALLDKRENWT
jgi:hypothetical protein